MALVTGAVGGGAVPSWWPTETKECYDDLVSYRLVGASACADRITAALEALATVVSVSASPDEFSATLRGAGQVFCDLKPDTALYVNVVNILTASAGRPGIDDFQRSARRLRTYRVAAQDAVVHAAAEALAEASVVLVHDYSSMVLRIMTELGRSRAREVIVTAGEPLGQGPRVARLMAEAGHHITYIPDMSVGRHIDRVDAFLTGVETFYKDGSLTNTIGSMQLALLCRYAGARVIASAESLKMHPLDASARIDDLNARMIGGWPRGSETLPPAVRIDDHILDAVPALLIDTFVTEHGASRPDSVGAIARRAVSQMTAEK